MPRPLLVGIVNITEDSFSDGGRFLDPAAAIAQARLLAAEGADIVELGAAASNVAARPLAPAEEIRRLDPVIAALADTGARGRLSERHPGLSRSGGLPRFGRRALPARRNACGRGRGPGSARRSWR